MNELIKYRVAKGLTQSNVGKLLGATKATISRWENDQRRPDPAMAIAIEKKLGIPRHLVRPDIYSEVSSPAVDSQYKSKRVTMSPKRKSLAGCMKGMVTFPPDFDPSEPFWGLYEEELESSENGF